MEQLANRLFDWFKSNYMKGNEDICHVVINTDKTMQVNIGIIHINNSKCEKLLGHKTDSELSFRNYTRNICKKAGAKLNVSPEEHKI